MFSKKATKLDEIFAVDLTLRSKCQIDGDDSVNFCGLVRKHELERNVPLLDFKTLSPKIPKFRSPILKTTQPKSFYYCPTLCLPLHLSSGLEATMMEDKSGQLVAAVFL